jgi:hypothetical protein
MTELRTRECRQSRLAAVLRRSKRCLRNIHSPKLADSLQRILSVYNKWSTTGYAGASESIRLLQWSSPKSPEQCMRSTGFGYVYVIINLKQRFGVYVGWTVQNIIDRFYEHAYSKTDNKCREVLLRWRMLQNELTVMLRFITKYINCVNNTGSPTAESSTWLQCY